jgi:menaquinone-dependent protoporphyrinogen oxidase
MLRRVRSQLDARPTWLFSSGPIGGTPDGDRLIDTVCGPDTDAPLTLSKALSGLHVLGHATFPGKVSERASGMLERDVPRGDWRNFRQVVSWGRLLGDEIADVTDVRRSPRIRHA